MSDARQFEESQESQDEPTTPKGPRVKTESAGPRTPTPKQPGTRLPKSPGSPVRGLYARHKGEAPSKSRSQNVTAQYGSDVPSLTHSREHVSRDDDAESRDADQSGVTEDDEDEDNNGDNNMARDRLGTGLSDSSGTEVFRIPAKSKASTTRSELATREPVIIYGPYASVEANRAVTYRWLYESRNKTGKYERFNCTTESLIRNQGPVAARYLNEVMTAAINGNKISRPVKIFVIARACSEEHQGNPATHTRYK